MHELDPSAFTDVKSSSRHVRTRLYFTSEAHILSLFSDMSETCPRHVHRSESHILSLFNVLRYGHEVLAATQGERASRGVQCIFSDEAQIPRDSPRFPEIIRDYGVQCIASDEALVKLEKLGFPEIPRDSPRLPEIARVPESTRDQARVKFEKLDVGYLSHIVFRVLHKKNADPQVPSSYAVQVHSR